MLHTAGVTCNSNMICDIMLTFGYANIIAQIYKWTVAFRDSFLTSLLAMAIVRCRTHTHTHIYISLSYAIATECKNISRKLNIENHLPSTKLNPAFITIKDYKENFTNNAKCRLINPTKQEIGKVSQKNLDKMNVSIRCNADVNQWRSTKEFIRWFNNLENKKQLSYHTFHIAYFYPSITDNPLIKTLKWAHKYHNIAVTEFDATMHARRTILYDHNGKVWTTRNSKNLFDVSMGANDGAEICELIGLYILTEIHKNIDFTSVGLHRDDGLAVIRSASGSSLDRYRKKLITLFEDNELKITVETGKTSLNVLDINFCLNSESYQPYRKPSDEPLYINRNSNHPPTILPRLPQTISKRISSLSSNFELFSRAAPIYNAAL